MQPVRRERQGEGRAVEGGVVVGGGQEGADMGDRQLVARPWMVAPPVAKAVPLGVVTEVRRALGPVREEPEE